MDMIHVREAAPSPPHHASSMPSMVSPGLVDPDVYSMSDRLGVNHHHHLHDNDLQDISDDSDVECSDSRSLNGEASSNEVTYGPEVKYSIEDLCPVCGDKVSGYHYGLQTCESCKGFFKRTVQNKKVYSCVDNRNCAIDKTQRKRCPYCRFQKCLNVGMKLEAVRPDRMRGGRNKFGPMYKRDRAMKQQAVRQRQHLIAQYQMHLAAAGGGMPMLPHSTDGLDIKPDIAAINMAMSTMGTPLPPHSVAGPLHNNYQGPPMHGHIQQMLPPSGHSGHSNDGHGSPPALDMSTSSSQGHYIPPPHPHLYPSMGPPMPHPHMAHPPPLQPMYPMQPEIPQPPTVPMLIKDLQANEPNEQEIQQKMARYAENEFLQIQQQPQANRDVSEPRDLARDFLQLMCKLCDQCLFMLVEWARSSHFFKTLKVDDQMKLLQNYWSELILLDFIYRQRKHNKLDEFLLVTGQTMKGEMLALMGLNDVHLRLQDIVKKMRELRIDRNEYTCLKFLILLNPDISGLTDRIAVEDSQVKINAALEEYCKAFYPQINDKFGQLLLRLPEVRTVSLRLEEYLYFRHLNGEVPEQTLLMEMLHAKRK